eukprot:TRINITY_DN4032_c0_g1_i3.p1 TRINITY_DN4032_c0_g1~~TRINITY_DN4032_c0_g1_i3.p1  ORF type:complete len:2762 (+),score=623.50 TRINITY_DN4032_c0_g1_i3:110-8395(+)
MSDGPLILVVLNAIWTLFRETFKWLALFLTLPEVLIYQIAKPSFDKDAIGWFFVRFFSVVIFWLLIILQPLCSVFMAIPMKGEATLNVIVVISFVFVTILFFKIWGYRGHSKKDRIGFNDILDATFETLHEGAAYAIFLLLICTVFHAVGSWKKFKEWKSSNGSKAQLLQIFAFEFSMLIVDIIISPAYLVLLICFWRGKYVLRSENSGLKLRLFALYQSIQALVDIPCLLFLPFLLVSGYRWKRWERDLINWRSTAFRECFNTFSDFLGIIIAIPVFLTIYRIKTLFSDIEARRQKYERRIIDQSHAILKTCSLNTLCLMCELICWLMGLVVLCSWRSYRLITRKSNLTSNDSERRLFMGIFPLAVLCFLEFCSLICDLPAAVMSLLFIIAPWRLVSLIRMYFRKHSTVAVVTETTGEGEAQHEERQPSPLARCDECMRLRRAIIYYSFAGLLDILVFPMFLIVLCSVYRFKVFKHLMRHIEHDGVTHGIMCPKRKDFFLPYAYHRNTTGLFIPLILEFPLLIVRIPLVIFQPLRFVLTFKLLKKWTQDEIRAPYGHQTAIGMLFKDTCLAYTEALLFIATVFVEIFAIWRLYFVLKRFGGVWKQIWNFDNRNAEDTNSNTNRPLSTNGALVELLFKQVLCGIMDLLLLPFALFAIFIPWRVFSKNGRELISVTMKRVFRSKGDIGNIEQWAIMFYCPFVVLSDFILVPGLICFNILFIWRIPSIIKFVKVKLPTNEGSAIRSFLTLFSMDGLFHLVLWVVLGFYSIPCVFGFVTLLWRSPKYIARWWRGSKVEESLETNQNETTLDLASPSFGNDYQVFFINQVHVFADIIGFLFLLFSSIMIPTSASFFFKLFHAEASVFESIGHGVWHFEHLKIAFKMWIFAWQYYFHCFCCMFASLTFWRVPLVKAHLNFFEEKAFGVAFPPGLTPKECLPLVLDQKSNYLRYCRRFVMQQAAITFLDPLLIPSMILLLLSWRSDTFVELRKRYGVYRSPSHEQDTKLLSIHSLIFLHSLHVGLKIFTAFFCLPLLWRGPEFYKGSKLVLKRMQSRNVHGVVTLSCVLLLPTHFFHGLVHMVMDIGTAIIGLVFIILCPWRWRVILSKCLLFGQIHYPPPTIDLFKKTEIEEEGESIECPYHSLDAEMKNKLRRNQRTSGIHSKPMRASMNMKQMIEPNAPSMMSSSDDNMNPIIGEPVVPSCPPDMLGMTRQHRTSASAPLTSEVEIVVDDPTAPIGEQQTRVMFDMPQPVGGEVVCGIEEGFASAPLVPEGLDMSLDKDGGEGAFVPEISTAEAKRMELERENSDLDAGIRQMEAQRQRVEHAKRLEAEALGSNELEGVELLDPRLGWKFQLKCLAYDFALIVTTAFIVGCIYLCYKFMKDDFSTEVSVGIIGTILILWFIQSLFGFFEKDFQESIHDVGGSKSDVFGFLQECHVLSRLYSRILVALYDYPVDILTLLLWPCLLNRFEKITPTEIMSRGWLLSSHCRQHRRERLRHLFVISLCLLVSPLSLWRASWLIHRLTPNRSAIQCIQSVCTAFICTMLDSLLFLCSMFMTIIGPWNARVLTCGIGSCNRPKPEVEAENGKKKTKFSRVKNWNRITRRACWIVLAAYIPQVIILLWSIIVPWKLWSTIRTLLSVGKYEVVPDHNTRQQVHEKAFRCHRGCNLFHMTSDEPSSPASEGHKYCPCCRCINSKTGRLYLTKEDVILNYFEHIFAPQVYGLFVATLQLLAVLSLWRAPSLFRTISVCVKLHNNRMIRSSGNNSRQTIAGSTAGGLFGRFVYHFWLTFSDILVGITVAFSAIISPWQIPLLWCSVCRCAKGKAFMTENGLIENDFVKIRASPWQCRGVKVVATVLWCWPFQVISILLGIFLPWRWSLLWSTLTTPYHKKCEKSWSVAERRRHAARVNRSTGDDGDGDANINDDDASAESDPLTAISTDDCIYCKCYHDNRNKCAIGFVTQCDCSCCTLPRPCVSSFTVAYHEIVHHIHPFWFGCFRSFCAGFCLCTSMLTLWRCTPVWNTCWTKFNDSPMSRMLKVLFICIWMIMKDISLGISFALSCVISPWRWPSLYRVVVGCGDEDDHNKRTTNSNSDTIEESKMEDNVGTIASDQHQHNEEVPIFLICHWHSRALTMSLACIILWPIEVLVLLICLFTPWNIISWIKHLIKPLNYWPNGDNLVPLDGCRYCYITHPSAPGIDPLSCCSCCHKPIQSRRNGFKLIGNAWSNSLLPLICRSFMDMLWVMVATLSLLIAPWRVLPVVVLMQHVLFLRLKTLYPMKAEFGKQIVLLLSAVMDHILLGLAVSSIPLSVVVFIAVGHKFVIAGWKSLRRDWLMCRKDVWRLRIRDNQVHAPEDILPTRRSDVVALGQLATKSSGAVDRILWWRKAAIVFVPGNWIFPLAIIKLLGSGKMSQWYLTHARPRREDGYVDNCGFMPNLDGTEVVPEKAFKKLWHTIMLVLYDFSMLLSALMVLLTLIILSPLLLVLAAPWFIAKKMMTKYKTEALNIIKGILFVFVMVLLVAAFAGFIAGAYYGLKAELDYYHDVEGDHKWIHNSVDFLHDLGDKWEEHVFDHLFVQRFKCNVFGMLECSFKSEGPMHWFYDVIVRNVGNVLMTIPGRILLFAGSVYSQAAILIFLFVTSFWMIPSHCCMVMAFMTRTDESDKSIFYEGLRSFFYLLFYILMAICETLRFIFYVLIFKAPTIMCGKLGWLGEILIIPFVLIWVGWPIATMLVLNLSGTMAVIGWASSAVIVIIMILITRFVLKHNWRRQP